MKKSSLRISLELLWWLFTAIVVGIVLIPIYLNIPDYPFFLQNALFIIALITFSRYIFLLPTTWLANLKKIKVVIILIAFITVFIMATAFADYRNYIDETGMLTLVDHIHASHQMSWIRYMKNEMVFFAVGSMITTVALAIRMIISLWRMKNSDRV